MPLYGSSVFSLIHFSPSFIVLSFAVRFLALRGGIPLPSCGTNTFACLVVRIPLPSCGTFVEPG